MNVKSYLLLASLFFFWSTEAMAVDSYRYLHVTIDTPWMIFIFLFFLVFAPMILAAILSLRSAWRGDDKEDDERGNRGARRD
jgi:hypothetical protein